MYVNRIEKIKRTLTQIMGNEEKVSANDILQAVEDAFEAITILEDECEKIYCEGKIDGLEWMATTLMQTERRE